MDEEGFIRLRDWVQAVAREMALVMIREVVPMQGEDVIAMFRQERENAAVAVTRTEAAVREWIIES